MNTADFHISLDIHESNAQAALRIKKGDTARRILITLTEHGRTYRITDDCKAVFTARKPDGHLLYNACTVQGNRIVYALTAQTAAAAGEVRCELRLYGADSALITSPRFLLLVDDTVYSDGDLVESSAEFSELTQMVNKVETLKTEIEEALKNGDFKGETGETSLPVARAGSEDGIAYTATDAGSGSVLPKVALANSAERIEAIGKGRQIVFIPWEKNQSEAPTLQLNGGEVIPIRLRASKNQGSSDDTPDATLSVPVGALMRGVPYTLTFCGKYWLIDSRIAQFSASVADMLNAYADALIGLTDADTIALPIVNSMDGVSGDISTMFVSRAAHENAEPNLNGDVTVPTEARVSEMLRKDITKAYTAWTPAGGTWKLVENYAKTLPDGKYYIEDGYASCFVDVFTSYGDVQWRVIRKYTDEFSFIRVYCGSSLLMDIDAETADVMINSKKMLTNYNIPLPTTADVGKVLVASTKNCASWTAVANAEEVAV